MDLKEFGMNMIKIHCMKISINKNVFFKKRIIEVVFPVSLLPDNAATHKSSSLDHANIKYDISAVL